MNLQRVVKIQIVLIAERRPFGPPTGGSEGLSIVAAVMLQVHPLTELFERNDQQFDSCLQ